MNKYYKSKILLFQIAEKWGVPFFFLLLYVLFPTNNSTVDGWGYAEEIKYGYNLFRPHHLLYNALGYVFIKGIQFIGFYPDVLWALKMLNALSAFGILLILRKILCKMGVSLIDQNLWMFFVGSSFGFWRFATENEVYLIPILLSLAASFYFWLFIHEHKRIQLICSSLFASLACLFHQLHIFWWLALLLGLFFKPRDKKSIGIYLLISLVVPFSYSVVLFFYEQESINIGNMMAFVLREYYTGTAEATIDFRNFLLTPISLFRTFFQVHGNIILFFKSSPWLYSVAGTSILIAIISVFQLRKTRYLNDNIKRPWFKIHLIAFALHLLFAFFSHGNAEFMTVLIVLIPILINQVFIMHVRFVALISLSMFIWNLLLAILPNNRLDYNNDEALVSFIKEQPSALFILSDRNTIANRYLYENGVSIAPRLLSLPVKENCAQLSSLQNEGVSIFTDILSKKAPMSRGALLENMEHDELILMYTEIIRVESFYGAYSIDRVKIKCD